jgi:hypothetical protein
MTSPTANIHRICLQKDNTIVVDYIVRDIGANKIRLIIYDNGNEMYQMPIAKDGSGRIKIQISPLPQCNSSFFQIEQYWQQPDGTWTWIALSSELNRCEKCRRVK